MSSLKNIFQNFVQNNIKAQPWPQASFVLPNLQVHRGYHLDGTQENTLEAFRQAAARGAMMCECDVRLSLDQVPVIVHDADLLRVAQKKLKVEESLAQDLFIEGNVPSLEMVLRDTKVPPFLNIELKTKKKDDSLPRQVAKVMSACRKENFVLFSSFNPFALWMMQNILPMVPRALLVTQENAEGNHFLLKEMAFVPLLRLHMLNLDQQMVTPELLRKFRGKMPISVWTVNDAEKANELLSQGVQSIITDQIFKLN